jgi:FkbM family methyltransferase
MRITEADGLWWYDDPGTGDELGPAGHEAPLEGQVLGMLPPQPPGGWKFPDTRGCFLDVGAHTGHYTARGYRVIAVEANPDTAGRLLANVTLNNLHASVRIIPRPAWDTYESMTWDDMGIERNGSAQARPAPDGRLWPVVLDDVLGAERIDAVKIDTEGAELHVLRGLRSTLKRCRPPLFIEDHCFLGVYSTAELLELLGELGYRQAGQASYGGIGYHLCEPA